MKAPVGSPALGALLRAALAEVEVAVRSWRQVESSLDLDGMAGDEYDAVCLLGSRFERLGIDSGDRPRIAGIARHSWAANQVAFAVLDGVDGAPVAGRWATIAHLPAGWVLPAGPGAPLRRFRGPVVDADLAGRIVEVPTIEAQLVDVLVGRRWVDAACLFAVDPEPAVVATEASRRRQCLAVGSGLRHLAGLVGPTVVKPAQVPTFEPSALDVVRERLWTALFSTVATLKRQRSGFE